MKILVISNLFPPEFLGGYELGCAQMTAALRKCGHHVRVATSASHSGPEDAANDVRRVLELSPIYNVARVAATEPALRRYFDLLAATVNPMNLHMLGDMIADFDPDVIYLWNLLGLGGLGILELLRRARIPWVWHIMDMVPRQLCLAGGSRFAHSVCASGIFSSGTYLGCSSRALIENEQDGISLGDDTHLIPNWVATSDRMRSSAYRAGSHLRIVFAAGLLGPPKGADILIRVAARLGELGYANFHIDLFGREVDGYARTLVHEFGVEDKVNLMGISNQEDLLVRYREYDLFAFPTWQREPFGFAPLEAAAIGCVPLFTDDCGVSEWLVDNVHCLKAERTVEAFARRIVEVLDGSVDLVEIGARAQAVIHRDFHIDAIAPVVEQHLLARARAAPPRRRVGPDFHKLVRFAEGLLPALLAEAEF
ncbi:MAG TPA: glycosyltransferase family 4 protein [Solirubrobacteraceae bacterium]|nr:glycosyltransferase family 4 protein [Solirubrobacteraceae bacterium]